MQIHEIKEEAVELEEKAKQFIADFEPKGKINLINEGQKLASKLRSHSISLGSSKAYEMSPLCQTTALAAAKVAYLVYGPDSKALDTYEKEVRHYDGPLNPKYTAFKHAWRDKLCPSD